MPPIFDAHCHIIDSAYPLIANNGYVPGFFSADDYLTRVTPLGVVGGAVVSGSFQGYDQSYLIAALKRLGPEFVGVTQLPASVTDAELASLHGHGVRALRFNLKRGGSGQLDQLESLAMRVHEQVGWHAELYIDSRELAGLEQRLRRLPALSIDHLGLSQDGLPSLLRLAEHGVRIKAYRSSCRRNEAASGGEAVVRPGTAVCQLNLVLRIYDDYVAGRSLVPTAAATQHPPPFYPPYPAQMSTILNNTAHFSFFRKKPHRY